MRLPGRGRDSDVIDARGSGGGGGGGLGGLPMGRAGGGIGVIGVVIYLAIQLLGGGAGFDVSPAFDDGTTAPDTRGIPASQDPDKDLRDFSGAVFSNVLDSWQATFREQGRDFQRPKLYLYTGSANTGCGYGSAAQGPFYCPADQRVYLDLSFYKEMARQLNAPGDFAWAYVIAHEVGHHVQRELGTEAQVRKLQQQDPSSKNDLSVRLELQADCYAGVWAHSAYEQGTLERGDIEEAITASQAVGDDRLQKQAGQAVNPDSFTHGTSAQRSRWFRTGDSAGKPSDCDTFSGDI
jgi:predicted metalloprotease